MSDLIGSFLVSGGKVIFVAGELDGEILKLAIDETWPLQTGDRSKAMAEMHRRVRNTLTENKIGTALVKGSALSTGGTKLAHLESAEIRGVVIAAAAEVVPVSVPKKASLSKTFGSRKVDEYLKDSDFWGVSVIGALRGGSREAALMILSTVKD